MSNEAQLVGKWSTDPNDTKSIARFGEVSLEFSADGKLEYVVNLTDRRQIIRLQYRVEGPGGPPA